MLPTSHAARYTEWLAKPTPVLSRLRAVRIVRGFAARLRNQIIGGEHGADEQEGKNQRPRELGVAEADMENHRQDEGTEPANRVLFQELALFGCGHGVFGLGVDIELKQVRLRAE